MSGQGDQLLSIETILTLAERESGAHGLIDPGLAARVGDLVAWINARGPFGGERVSAIQAQILRLLVARLRIASDRLRFSGIAGEPIERPVFIIGFPRSGTTLLHALLAEDPEVLAPVSWHMLEPSPPPGAGPVVSGRIARAQRVIEAWMDFCPPQAMMHPYIDKGAFQLCEDEELFSLDFRTMYPYHYYHVPVAEVNALLGGDPAGALRFHREFLQHIQWNGERKRWVCKGPSTQSRLAALFDIYPDALCVWPHRPLGEIYASNVALRASIYDRISGRANDWNSQSQALAERMKAGLDQVLDNALIDDPRILHIDFRDIVADPLAVVERVYRQQDRVLTPEAANRMRAWLADPENAADRYGRYPYSYEAFGLDRQWVERLFADYSARFGLENAG